MRSQLKIQLGEGDILALLGGGGDASVEIRNHIVQEFTKRHLKALANQEMVAKGAAVVIRAVREEIAQQIGTADWNHVVSLSPALKQKIQQEVGIVVRSEVQAAVNSAWRDAIQPSLDELVNKRLDAITETYINAAAEKKLKAMLAAAKAE